MQMKNEREIHGSALHLFPFKNKEKSQEDSKEEAVYLYSSSRSLFSHALARHRRRVSSTFPSPEMNADIKGKKIKNYL